MTMCMELCQDIAWPPTDQDAASALARARSLEMLHLQHRLAILAKFCGKEEITKLYGKSNWIHHRSGRTWHEVIHHKDLQVAAAQQLFVGRKESGIEEDLVGEVGIGLVRLTELGAALHELHLQISLNTPCTKKTNSYQK